jgi:hypothetical protein
VNAGGHWGESRCGDHCNCTHSDAHGRESEQPLGGVEETVDARIGTRTSHATTHVAGPGRILKNNTAAIRVPQHKREVSAAHAVPYLPNLRGGHAPVLGSGGIHALVARVLRKL